MQLHLKRLTGVLSISLISGLIMAGSFDDASAQEGRKGKFKDRRGKGKTERVDNAPKVGDTAPLFTLESQDGKSKTTLADFKDKKPVVMFFGSYT